jgi:2-oxo-4-hydroxy-4-carboxy-5-ureidoimidazoline decarboxylase
LIIKEELIKCCGSENWVNQMIDHGDFVSDENLIEISEKIWFSLKKEDWLEAFRHHPKIGDINSLKEKYSVSKDLAESEQAGVKTASMDTLTELSKFNDEYEKKFGYIFIVCATGKSAEEMLSIIKSRINNDPEEEIMNAMKEQNEITKIRLNQFKTD